MYENIDLLIISFEGVLGAFLPIAAQDRGEKNSTNKLCIRPGLAAAMTEMSRNFKIAIVSKEESPVRRRLILKALNKNEVPFDAFYRLSVEVTNDNLFTYKSIKRDFSCSK